MKKFYTYLLGLACCTSLLFSACSSDSADSTTEPAQSNETSTPVPEEIKDPNTVKAAFESAASYAAATDYVFLTMDRVRLKVRVINGELATGQPEVPANLLTNDGSEGPAIANPDMIGQFFYLKKDGEGRVIKVTPVAE